MGVYQKYKSRYSGENLRNGLDAVRVGERVKIESDRVMNETWWNDPASQVAYFYDWYHDDHKTQLRDLDPKHDHRKTPVDIKFIVDAHQSMAKDTVTKHLMLRPGQGNVVDYYDEYFAKRYDSLNPCGLYVDIADNTGRYNRWLVVAIADFYDPQFPKFQILPCDKVIQYVYKGIKYNVPGVLQSQNSYNSGLWTDYIFIVPYCGDIIG